MSTPTTESPDYTQLGYTAGQVATLTALEQHSRELGLSQEAFSAEHLQVSSTTWLRIRKGTYAGNREQVFAKLDLSLRQLRIELARRARNTGSRTYHWFAPANAVMNAITAARMRRLADPERLIIVEGTTGAGKTALGAQIRSQLDTVFVEASEAWRTDYRSAAIQVARAAGAGDKQTGRLASLLEIEDTLLTALSARRRVLLIDEAEYFTAKTANLLKLILNRTETVVVLLCIPQLRERWMAAAQREADQLLRRAVVIDLGKVTPGDVEPFLDGLPLGSGLRSSAAAIARAANYFGSFSTVVRVVDRLRDEEPEKLELDDVSKAISLVQHLQRKGGES